jgi:iron complex outermembrane recepter protein
VKNPLTSNDVPANYTIGGQPYSFEDVNHDFGEVKRYGFRVASLFKPSDSISFLYAFDWSRDKSTGGYWHVNSTTQTVIPAVFAARDSGRASVARLAVPVLPSTAKTQGHSFTAEWEISDALTLKTISGWRKLNGIQWDQDAGGISRWNTAAQGRLSFARVLQKQQSHELQLIGDVGDLKFVTGAYYFKESGADTATVFRSVTLNGTGTGTTFRNPATTSNVVSGAINLLQDRAAEADIKSKALFAQATYSPGESGLHLTVGGRYTDDQKDGRLTFLTGAPNVFPGGTAPRNIAPFVFKSSRFDPMATVAYDFSDDINAYVKYGRAYRAGGANTRSAILRTFGEEELTSYEIGIKADLFDRRARVNLAAYTSGLKDAQFDFVNPANVSATETLNVAGKTKVKGIEVDVTLVPTRGLTLGVNYVYTRFGQRAVTNPFSNLVELVNIANTPKHALSASLDYDFGTTSLGRPRLHIDADNVGGYFASAVPSGDPARNKKTWLINGRLSLSEIPIFGENLEVAVWAKNLTNRTYQQSDFIVPTGAGSNFTTFYNEPRNYGLEFRVRF